MTMLERPTLTSTERKRIRYTDTIPDDIHHRMERITKLYDEYPLIRSLMTDPQYAIEQNGERYIPKQLILSLIVNNDQTELDEDQIIAEDTNLQTWRNKYPHFETRTVNLPDFNQRNGFYSMSQATHLILFLHEKYSQHHRYSLRNTPLPTQRKQEFLTKLQPSTTSEQTNQTHIVILKDPDGNTFTYNTQTHTLSCEEETRFIEDIQERLLFELHIYCQITHSPKTKESFAAILSTIIERINNPTPKDLQAFDNVSRLALEQYDEFYDHSSLARLNAQRENPGTFPKVPISTS